MCVLDLRGQPLIDPEEVLGAQLLPGAGSDAMTHVKPASAVPALLGILQELRSLASPP